MCMCVCLRMYVPMHMCEGDREIRGKDMTTPRYGEGESVL